MAEERIPELASRRGKALLCVLWGVFALHAIMLLVFPHLVIASRIGTALLPLCATGCCVWRSLLFERRERIAWQWIGLTLLLWSTAQFIEIYLTKSSAISSPVIDASDLLYVVAAFPVLLAIANTRETESVRSTLYLNMFQVALAVGLTYVRLFRMGSAANGTTLYWIYGAECLLLAVAASVRMVSWLSEEERRRMRLLSHVLWLYLPIEVGLDYASAHWGLRKGTLLDLLWGLPFLYAGMQAIRMPVENGKIVEETQLLPPKPVERRSILLLQSWCPMLITCGVFALAASIAGPHMTLALSALLLLLLVQGLHASVIQAKYLLGQEQLVQSREELKTANTGLARLSLLDPLTGISNRRRFTEAFDNEWRRALRKRESMAILMIDIDFFKSVNDLHGHLYGDRCLIQVAQALRITMMRGNDLVARYGGEEFIILLPDTGVRGASILAARLLAAIEELNLRNDGSPFDQIVTVSIGIAAEEPALGRSQGAVIERADAALYRAKHEGRNRASGGDVALPELPRLREVGQM